MCGRCVSICTPNIRCAIWRCLTPAFAGASLAIDSKLRTGDLILDDQPKLRATVIQQKTRKPVTFELTEQTRDSLLGWLKIRGGNLEDYVFPSRTNAAAHISTRQYAWLVDE
jgi:integrase